MPNPYNQYQRNQAAYDKIDSELDTIRGSFETADRFTQKCMLFDSSVFAVISVQNDISILRRAFRGYRNADTWGDLREVMRSVNYGNNKFEYIRDNFDTIFHSHVGRVVVEQLEGGQLWQAIDTMVEHLGGVSYIKAPFIPAMLGFKKVMCIDTNVAQMVNDERVKAKGYKTLEEYKTAISLVKDEFPDLSSDLSTFMLQWVVFDANRNDGVARHEEWFEAMLPGTEFGRQLTL